MLASASRHSSQTGSIQIPKTVAIVTLEGNFNFGNLLQNFALQESLSSLGCSEVSTLKGIPVDGTPLAMLGRRLDGVFSNPLAKAGRLLHRARRTRDAHPSPIPNSRRKAIAMFAESRINYAPMSLGELREDSEVLSQYDYVIVGSDQVWNPDFTTGNPAWFLSFVPPERRIAYAASIGIPKIPRYLSRAYRDGLNGMHRISVREHQAAKTIQEFTGREPAVVVDPTLLPEASFWAGRATLPEELEGKDYVLDFRLKKGDGLPRDLESSAMDSVISRFVAKSNLDLVDLYAPDAGGLIGISPLDFIGAIRSAKLVLTDSFHAAVFCIIFHTPFLVEERGNMNSRFDSLFRISGLERMQYPASAEIEALYEIDWSAVDNQIAQSRMKSLSYLEEAIGEA